MVQQFFVARLTHIPIGLSASNVAADAGVGKAEALRKPPFNVETTF